MARSDLCYGVQTIHSPLEQVTNIDQNDVITMDDITSLVAKAKANIPSAIQRLGEIRASASDEMVSGVIQIILSSHASEDGAASMSRRQNISDDISSDQSAFILGQPGSSLLDWQCIIDPASDQGQRLLAVVQVTQFLTAVSLIATDSRKATCDCTQIKSPRHPAPSSSWADCLQSALFRLWPAICPIFYGKRATTD